MNHREDLQRAIEENMRSIFVFYDTKAQAFVGNQLYVSRHPAPIIREFYGHLSNPQGMGQYPKDFSVLHLGYVEDDGNIIPIMPLIVATGEAWAAERESHAQP